MLSNTFSFFPFSSMTRIWYDVASVDEQKESHFFCYKLYLVLWSYNLIHVTLSVNVLWCYRCYFDDKRIIFLYVYLGRCLLKRTHRCIPFLIRFWLVIKKHFRSFCRYMYWHIFPIFTLDLVSISCRMLQRSFDQWAFKCFPNFPRFPLLLGLWKIFFAPYGETH